MARPHLIFEPPREQITTRVDSVDSFAWSASSTPTGVERPAPSGRGHRTIRQILSAALGSFVRYTGKFEYYRSLGYKRDAAMRKARWHVR